MSIIEAEESGFSNWQGFLIFIVLFTVVNNNTIVLFSNLFSHAANSVVLWIGYVFAQKGLFFETIQLTERNSEHTVCFHGQCVTQTCNLKLFFFF